MSGCGHILGRRKLIVFLFFSSRRRHTRCALVTGVQTCALPISTLAAFVAAAGREPLELYVRDKNRAEFEAISQLRVERASGVLSVNRPPLRTALDLHDVDSLLIGVKHPQLAALIDRLPPVRIETRRAGHRGRGTVGIRGD